MENESSYFLEWLGRPAYAVAGYLIVHAIVTILASTWPLDLGSVVWRYGIEGTASGFLTPVLLGFLLASRVAVGLRHRLVLRALGVPNLLVAALCLVCTVDYGLNGLQIRAQVSVDNISSLRLAVIRGVSLYLVAAVLFVWIAIASYRAARRIEAVFTAAGDAHPLVSI